MEEKNIKILAIESSCDETAAAVVENGRKVLSNVISTQIDIHTLYGGVVPEIASRKHLERINQVVKEALKQASVTLEDIAAVGRSRRRHRRYTGPLRRDWRRSVRRGILWMPLQTPM